MAEGEEDKTGLNLGAMIKDAIKDRHGRSRTVNDQTLHNRSNGLLPLLPRYKGILRPVLCRAEVLSKKKIKICLKGSLDGVTPGRDSFLSEYFLPLLTGVMVNAWRPLRLQ